MHYGQNGRKNQESNIIIVATKQLYVIAILNISMPQGDSV